MDKQCTAMKHCCTHCGKLATLRCSRCQLVYYCSRQHQQSDWTEHRILCNRNKVMESNDKTKEDTSTKNKYECKEETRELALLKEQANSLIQIETRLGDMETSIGRVEKAIELLTLQMTTVLGPKHSEPSNNSTTRTAVPNTSSAPSGAKKSLTKLTSDKGKSSKLEPPTGKSSPFMSMHEAAAKGNVNALKLLLEHKPKDSVDKEGWTALMHAANAGHANCVTILLNHGFKNVTYELDEFTPLHRATRNGHSDCVTAMLKHGVNPDCKTILHSTALHFAAMDGHVNSLRALLHRGASVNAADSENITALHYAAGNGYGDCVQCLLEFRAEVNEKSVDGDTPLHFAGRSGHENVIRLLLKAGGDLTIRNEYKDRPIDSARKYAPKETRDFICSILKP